MNKDMFPLLICGLPASGKSTIAKTLSKENGGLKILEWDDLVKDFGSMEELMEERDLAQRIFHLRMKHGRPDIIVDVFQYRSDRLEALKVFNGNLSVAIVQCSLKTCLERNSRRKPMISNKEIKIMAEQFEPVAKGEGFKAFYTINGGRQ